jgi:thioredoxin reductase
MEAIIALARQPETKVTVCYRGDQFRRGKARNIDEVRRLAASERVRLLMNSTVERVEEGGARLRVRQPGGAHETKHVPVDVVLALLGGEPSRELLHAAGVRFEG